MTKYNASIGVPLPTVVVIVTGIMLLAGSLSTLLSYKVKIGAIVIVVFLIPTYFIAHSFWYI